MWLWSTFLVVSQKKKKMPQPRCNNETLKMEGWRVCSEIIKMCGTVISTASVNCQARVNHTLTEVALARYRWTHTHTHRHTQLLPTSLQASKTDSLHQVNTVGHVSVLCGQCEPAQRRPALRWHQWLLYQHPIIYVVLIRSLWLRLAGSSGWSREGGTGGWREKENGRGGPCRHSHINMLSAMAPNWDAGMS